VANKIEIEVEVQQSGPGMEAIRRRVTDDAKATGQAVDTAFSQAATATGAAFDRLQARIGSSFQKVTGDARSMWDRIGAESKAGADKAGSKSGEGFADSLKDKIGKLDFSSIGSNIGEGLSALSDVGGPIGLAAAGIGAAFADDIVTGFTRGFNANTGALALQIQTGLSAAEVGPIGRAAGEAYSEGFGESLKGLQSSAATLDNVLGEIDPSVPLQDAIRWASVLEEHFGVDIPRSAEIAGRMIHQGLAENTEDAYDTMIGASQRYRVAYDEILEVTREFGTTFSELGISGAQAADFVGQAWTRGLVPTIDRAGELFEEFVIEVQAGMTGRAAPAIEAVGFSFGRVQDAISDGRGGEAIRQLAAELLEMEDISYRNELAAQIFGTAIESAADKTAVLELIAELDNLGEGFDGAAEDSARMAEAMQSDLDVLKRDVENFAADAGENFSEFYADMKGTGENPWEKIRTDTAEFLGWLQGDFASVSDHVIEALDGVRFSAGRSFEEVEEEALDLTGGLGDVTAATEELDAAFARLTGQFDGDQAIRGLHDQIRELQQAEIDATASSYELGSGFDQTTAAGGAIAAQLEDLHGNLLDVAEAHRDGSATALELAQAQNSTEAALRSVAAQLGFTEAQTEDLIARYGQVPDDITTSVNAEGNAWSRTEALYNRLRGMDGQTYTTYINTHTRTVAQTVTGRGGGSTYHAAGGVAHAAPSGGMGAPVFVNDGGGMAGPESADLPNGDLVLLPVGSQVNSAEDTQRMRAAGEFDGGGSTVINNYFAGSLYAERDIEEIFANLQRRGGTR
jgi:hypothetical protein